MKWYYTKTGCKGYIPNDGYILFPTLNEYVEIYKEISENKGE